MDLKQLDIDIADLANQGEAVKKEANAKIDTINRAIDERIVLRQQILDGLDVGIISLAKSVLLIRGKYVPEPNQWRQERGDDGHAVDKAIADLCNGGEKMKRQYFGVKIYSGFGRQGHDGEYGYGPKHGTVVFSIGLQNEFRKVDLTDDQINACLYYLHNIEKIQTSANEAAA